MHGIERSESLYMYIDISVHLKAPNIVPTILHW